jgi:hypothetical protein
MTASLALAEGRGSYEPTLDYVEDRLQEVATAEVPACPSGQLCITPGAANTHVVTPDVASLKTTSSTSRPFARTAQVASNASGHGAQDTAPWTLMLVAARAVRPGPVLCLIFDAHDKQAIASRQVFGLYQTDVRGAARVALRLQLSPDDGFVPNHSYIIRLVQLARGKEISLAQGELTLL